MENGKAENLFLCLFFLLIRSHDIFPFIFLDNFHDALKVCHLLRRAYIYVQFVFILPFLIFSQSSFSIKFRNDKTITNNIHYHVWHWNRHASECVCVCDETVEWNKKNSKSNKQTKWTNKHVNNLNSIGQRQKN